MLKTPKIITGASNGPEYYRVQPRNFSGDAAGRPNGQPAARFNGTVVAFTRYHTLTVGSRDI